MKKHKDNSNISKEIINFIFKDKEFPNLTIEQQNILNKNLPEIFFELSRKNLKQNNKIVLDNGDTYKLNYNKKSDWVAWEGSQREIKFLAENFEIKNTDTDPKKNFVNLLKEVGLEEFFSWSLSQIKNHKEWIIINKNISNINRINTKDFDFTLPKLKSDIFREYKNKNTFFVTYLFNGEERKIFQIQSPASKSRKNSVILRINRKEIKSFIKIVKKTNETWGISVEVALCNIFNLEIPNSYIKRYDKDIVDKIEESIKEYQKYYTIPQFTEFCGTETKGRKKSSFDFKTNEKTISVKSNFNNGRMVCPPEFGQPGIKEGLKQYNDFFAINISPEELLKDNTNFKKQFINNIALIANRQLQLLFSEDYLFYIRQLSKGKIQVFFYEKENKNFVFEQEYFTFTRNHKNWVNSTSIKYKGKTIAEMQMHKNRSPFKFRFNLPNLITLLNED